MTIATPPSQARIEEQEEAQNAKFQFQVRQLVLSENFSADRLQELMREHKARLREITSIPHANA